MTALETMEADAREIGTLIGEALEPGVGFALVLFDVGATGNMTYISNAERAEVALLMRELADKMEADLERPAS